MFIPQPKINLMILQLIEKILPDRKQYKQIVGIANGGLHISKPIAKALNLPHCEVRISFYDNTNRRTTPIISPSTQIAINALVVDDLIDSGSTIKAYEHLYGPAKTAVLFCSPTIYEPTYWVSHKPKTWIVFPWETKLPILQYDDASFS